MKHSKIAIIGAGPAGIACAVQLKRYGLEPLLFEKNQIGGLLRNANLVENYLGFEKGISGKDLVEKFRKNLENSGVTPIFEETQKVSFAEGIFRLETDNGLFTSEILVIASGTKPGSFPYCHCEEEALLPTKQSKTEINDNLWIASDKCPRNDEMKFFYEIADLPKKDYSGKKFAIVGAGDAAFDYAINLVNNYKVSEVVILNRNDKAKCLPLLEKRAEETGKIEHIKNVTLNSIQGLSNDELLLKSPNGQIPNQVRNDKGFDYIIIAIGREACLDFLDENLTKNLSDLQNQELLYFVGDVANGNYRQSSIATGDGIKTAMKINSKINTIYL